MTAVCEKSNVISEVSPNAVRPRPSGWPRPLSKAALYGLTGEVVRVIDPHTEADPASILLQFLVALGNVVGRNPYFQVEATRHYLNTFVALVGETAKARKGTSWGHIDRLFALADVQASTNASKTSSWNERLLPGLSSGEGLIWVVRDPINSRDGHDPGVDDKRCMVVDGEFAQTLKMLGRQGNTLSPVIRNAWDGRDLRIPNKNSPAQATAPHISFVGHITRDELKRELSSTEMANGFANRFLWACVTRSKLLPEGGSLSDSDLKGLVERIRDVAGSAMNMSQMKRDEAARKLWFDVYPDLSAGVDGMLGAVTARGEAQVVRLAALYAVADQSPFVKLEHLNAALAVWDYCRASAGFLFGHLTGDPVADDIHEALRKAGSQGMTRTEIRDLLKRNQSKERIEAALRVLEDRHLADCKIFKNGDQRTETWFVR